MPGNLEFEYTIFAYQDSSAEDWVAHCIGLGADGYSHSPILAFYNLRKFLRGYHERDERSEQAQSIPPHLWDRLRVDDLPFALPSV